MSRPRLALTAKMIRQIERLASFGLTKFQIADVLEVSQKTLSRRKRDSEKVLRAMHAGRAKAEWAVGRALFRKALTGDVAAIRWWEMTRAGRTERQRQEITGKDGANVIVEHALMNFYMPDNGRERPKSDVQPPNPRLEVA